MALGYAVAMKNASLDQLTAQIDADASAATLKVYDGTRPATADTAVTSQVLLATFTMGDPSFPAAASGTMDANAIAPVVAAAAGTASWFRVEDGAGNTIYDGDITATGGGGDLEISSLAIVLSENLEITSLTINHP